MTKAEFLLHLGGLLEQLPEEDRQRHLEFYSEMIDDKTEEGMTEEQAVESLGSIPALANDILREMPLPVLVKTAVKPKNGWTPLAIVLAIVGFPIWLPIAIALGAVLLSVYVVIWAVVVCLFAAVLSIFAAGICFFWMMFFREGLANTMVLAGFGFGCAGLGILAFYGALAAAKGIVKLTAAIARGIKSIFIRR